MERGRRSDFGKRRTVHARHCTTAGEEPGAARSRRPWGTTLSVILSIADVTTSHADRPRGSSVFDRIHGDVRAREGFMIDSDHDIDGVAEFFLNKQEVTRFGYGNGTAVPLVDEGMMVYRTPIEKACWMRAVRGVPGFVARTNPLMIFPST